METPRKFITAKLSIRKPGSSSVLIICDLFNSHALFIYKSLFIYKTDEDPYGSREGTSDFGLQTSDFRLQTSDTENKDQ